MNGITYSIIACYIDKGMKSKGSKCLMEFNKKKLLDYQIEQIISGHKSSVPYEIIIITNFETPKIVKYFNSKIKVIDLDEHTNPLAKTCQESIYSNVFFIDYGCVYNADIIKEIINNDQSCVASVRNNKLNTLDIGLIIDYDTNTVQHLFFDLPPDNKFANMFFLQSDCVTDIKNNRKLQRSNLMYFEILNSLISSGNAIYNFSITDPNVFIFFNHMRQKHGITKFIKQNSIN